MAEKQQEFKGAKDRGLEGVVVCSTKLSAIQNSRLFIRGFDLEDLARNSSYEETVFLLHEGRLPSKQEWESWRADFQREMRLSEEERRLLKNLPFQNAVPMAWLRTAFSLLSLSEAEEDISPESGLNRLKKTAIRLTAKAPLLTAFFQRLREGRDWTEPVPEKSLAWNFLYLLKGKEPSENHAKILDICLILHAEHDLNCSVFSARVTASSLSDVYSALVSAIGTLKGPLHGGANERVMTMLQQFKTEEDGLNFVARALERKEKIMGFGHRVYKERDPRAEILKTYSQSLSKEAGRESLYRISAAMEKAVREKKGLCPNVDFYSASVYHFLGIPTDLFTPVFAVSRTAGWLAHILEQYSNNRIYRPKGEWRGAPFGQKRRPLSER